MPPTGTSGYFLYLEVHMVGLLLQPPHTFTQIHNHTHTKAHSMFTISSLLNNPNPQMHPSIPPCALCCHRPSDFPHSHVWQRMNHGPGERENVSFHSIRLTATRTLFICSLILSLFQFDQIWMHSLMCDARNISVHSGCQNHTERETRACRVTPTYTNSETHRNALW